MLKNSKDCECFKNNIIDISEIAQKGHFECLKHAIMPQYIII